MVWGIIGVNSDFSFPHSVVSAEGAAAAAAEMACQCPSLELAIPLRLGMQAAGYVALGNSLWWAVRSVGEIGEKNGSKCVLIVINNGRL